MTVWRDISTAPRGEMVDDEQEGPKVLVWLPQYGPWVARWRHDKWLNRPGTWFTTYSECMSDHWTVALDDRAFYAPTHWQPLPSPPTEDEK